MSALDQPARWESWRERTVRCWRLYLTAGLVLAGDVLTKVWVLATIPPGSYNPPWKTIIPDFLYLVHIGNTGAAFGMFQGFGWLLAILAILALFAIYWFRRDLELHRPGVQIIFGLIIGGILGNFIDRVVHGEVIDFIDVHLPFHLPGIGTRFPAFNVADSGITVGVLLYFIFSLFVHSGSPSRKAGSPESPPEK